jgi:hypothetical protein
VCVLLVNLCGNPTPKARARDLADPPITQHFEVSSILTYVIIDKKEEIRFRHVGPVSALKLKTEILSLVNE